MIYTFYSYKGGVGRSMAMANIAQWYYLNGKRVVMVDWDLEAPGIEGYFHSGESRLKEIRTAPGLIDMLEAYKTAYNKLNLEIAKAHQEVEMLPAKIFDELEQAEVDWNYVEAAFSKFALFDKPAVNFIKKEISTLYNQPAATGINEVVSIIRKVVSQPELLNTIALNINNRLQQEGFNLPSISIYLSTFSLLNKEEIAQLLSELKKIKSESNVNDSQVFEVIARFLPLNKTQQNGGYAPEDFINLQQYLQPVYAAASYESDTTPGLWLLSAGKREGEQAFAQYAQSVQNFNWTDFYVSYNGEAYFNCLREKLLQFADIVLVDSRTGISEMSGVSTRQLADTIVIITAPNPQNLTGATNMVRSFVNEEVMKARKNRELKIIILASRIDLSESQFLNKFQVEYYRTISEFTPGISGDVLWEMGIPYIPYYNYNENLAVGISDKPDQLENTGQSPLLDKKYRSIAAFLLDGNFAIEKAEAEKPAAPFIGLKPFEAKDAALFFGRSLEVSRMMELIATKRFLLLIGPANSGKSSILRAGLMPALETKADTSKGAAQIVVFCRCGAHPFVALAEAMAAKLLQPDSDGKDKAERLSRFFTTYPDKLKQDIHDALGIDYQQNLVVILDGFEDVFTQVDKVERDTFINALSKWVENKEAAVVVSLRTDYCIEFLSYTAVANLAEQALINLAVPTERELRQIITQPAARAGLKLEEGLTERILKDIEFINNKLPVLQITLNELWMNRSGNVLTHAAYDKLGKVDGVLKQIFEGVYKIITPAEFDAVQPILTCLVNVTTGTRQPLSLSEIDKDKRPLLKPFIDKGLLIVTVDEKTKTEILELAHDLLITSWPPLSQVLQQNKEFLAWRQQLTVQADNWLNKNKEDDLLLRGADLDEVKLWYPGHKRDLNEKKIQYIEKSIAKRSARRTERISTVITFAIFAVIAWFVFFNKKEKAEQTQTHAIDSVTHNNLRATQFAADYNASGLQNDLDYNVKMIQQYYTFSPAEQQSLQNVKTQIEVAVSYKFFDLVDSFYYTLRETPANASQYIADTLTRWGAYRNVAKATLQSRLKGLATYNISNAPVDSTIAIVSDSAGFKATFVETGNVLLYDNSFKEYKSIKNLDTLLFDHNLKIKSVAYQTIDSTSNKLVIEIFVCATRSNEVFKSVTNMVNVLKADGRFTVLTRNNFVSATDPSSPYYIQSSRIRYNGAEERQLATAIQNIIRKTTQLNVPPEEARTRTPNYISVFICGGDTPKTASAY